MPQYCSKAPTKPDKFEFSAAKWPQPQNKMLPSGRMKQKRSKKRKLDDGYSEVPQSAKKFISEEKMASYLQGLHIASDSHYQQQHIGVTTEGPHPTQQELLHQRLQGDNGTDEAFYSPDSINTCLVLHRSPNSSPEIRLNPPTPSNGNTGNARETKLHTLSRWDVIIEDLSSEEDDVPLQDQPTVHLSPEARENMGKSHLLPPSILDELCSKPCMELIPWVPKEKIVQDSLLRSAHMEGSSSESLRHSQDLPSIKQEQHIKQELRDYYRESSSSESLRHSQDWPSIKQEQHTKQELWDYDENDMEL